MHDHPKELHGDIKLPLIIQDAVLSPSQLATFTLFFSRSRNNHVDHAAVVPRKVSWVSSTRCKRAAIDRTSPLADSHSRPLLSVYASTCCCKPCHAIHKQHPSARIHSSYLAESILDKSVRADTSQHGHHIDVHIAGPSDTPRDVVHDRYKLSRKLGSGGFGDVYAARDMRTGAAVAVKMSRRLGSCSALQMERDVYRAVARLPSGERAGFANKRFSGQHDRRDVLVIDRLGASLESLMRDKGSGFSTKSVLMIGIQTLKRLQILHEAGFLHRDVKPDNMLVGYEDRGRIYLVDFGLAKKYRQKGLHIPFRTGKGAFLGTTHFASVRAHDREELDRRDDLMSLGYSLVYLFYGKLPWQGVVWQTREGNREKIERIGDLKKKTSMRTLIGHMPREFDKYFEYVQKLRFGQTPNYHFLRTLFRKSMDRKKMDDDRVFEWMQP